MPCRVFQQPTLSDMTMYEMNFSLLVEDMLGNIDQPKYRQIVVEVRAQSPLPACSPERAQRDARAARSGTPLTGPSAGPEGDGHPGPGQGTGVHGECTGREARPPVWEGDGNVSARVAAAVHAIGFDVRPFQLLMVVSVVLERNPELEFQDKVDLDKLVKEAFHEFQKDESRLKEVEKQVSRENSFLLIFFSLSRFFKISLISYHLTYKTDLQSAKRSTQRAGGMKSDLLEELMFLFSEITSRFNHEVLTEKKSRRR